jgi:hypothetical protein
VATKTNHWNRLDAAPNKNTALHHHSKFSVPCCQEETTPFRTLIQGKMTQDFSIFSIITVEPVHNNNGNGKKFKHNCWNYSSQT